MNYLSLYFNTEDNNMPILGSLPTSGSKRCISFCEVLNEWVDDSNAISTKVDEELEKQNETYRKYLQEDHSDLGPHYHAFQSSIPLMNGYEAYVGMYWPQTSGDEPDIEVALIKDCDVRGVGYIMAMAPASQDNHRIEPVFFTERFLEIYGDCTKSPRSLFFLDDIWYESLFSEDDMGEVRWLLPKGVAFGYRYCHFCVFNEFNDVLKYPDGNVSPDDRDNLLDSLWNDI